MTDRAIPTLETEIQRLQCLQALGITVYHPRFVLPGARPSVQGIWPDAELAAQADTAPRTEAAPRAEMAPRADVPATRTNATACAEVTAPRTGAARPAVIPAEAPSRPAGPIATRAQPAAGETGSATSSGTSRGASGASRGAEPASAPVQNFQLLFLQIDDDLALINQIPALARPQLQDKQMALLANLLRWLGKSVPAQAPRMFRWPLPGLEHMAANMSPETSLLHFLEQASSERGFRFLLQLGPQAAAPAAPAWQSFTTHSLDEMLALPALKREVWQSLLPLHALLHAGS